ncbi:MAG: histidinol-phosphate transaminase [Blastocatellia bacterium]|nr:histidinol-phosphate transaminase [Blastocatellia bacterium]MCS7157562.1 histidinol-phosphate transaminase [Blastocatellia bacterium]MCX7753514.1 histidinol-phosphate transaminase [Blastocatellia bacterium]MDW8166930.1 histidinol-phosphate transaminase [Acidobacteriota bacterium]MDW8257507.1 histidinol-phosphate transaminase [Acidobacteriota bacterium]
MRAWWEQRLDELDALEGYPIPEGDELSEGKLDANENVLLPKALLVTLAQRAVETLDPRFYAIGDARALVRDLSRYLGIEPEHIVLGSGGDQLIDLVAQAFLEPGATAVTIAPTYSFYRIRCAFAGARVIEVPLREDFSLDLEALARAAHGARVLFLCSPNNPTGNQFPLAEIEHLAREFSGLLIVDEAYVEFASETALPLLARSTNVVLLRTFSKAFGLAGMRLGYLLAPPRLSRLFAEKVQYPYPVNAFAVRLARLLLEAYEEVRATIETVKREREWLRRALQTLGVRAFPSQTNFVLFEVGDRANMVWRHLAEHGLRVKYVGEVLGYGACLRATVGSPETNRALIARVQEALG